MEKRRPPPRRSFARVQRLPFTALHCKTRGVSCSRRQTPRRVEKRRPPRAVLLPRVQRSPFRWTYHPPRPFRTAGGQSLNTAPPRGATSKRRPNIDNVDNMDTDGRRVEAIPHEQEKQTAPNMDNVDNRTQTRPPCGEEEAAPALFFCRVCSVCPFV